MDEVKTAIFAFADCLTFVTATEISVGHNFDVSLCGPLRLIAL
jgi:hypothetical protein